MARPPRFAGAELDAILQEACERKQFALVATPYFALESRFLERRGDVLALRANQSRESLRHALAQHPLRLRLAWDLSMLAGATEIVGFEQDERTRALLVKVPASLALDERRGAFRVESLGRSRGALVGGLGRIIRVSLENLSLTGAGIFCTDALAPGEIFPGQQVDLEVVLDKGPQFRTRARVAHGEGQSLGLSFQPPLPDYVQAELRAWLAPREGEARRLWENRGLARAAAELAARPKAAPRGLLLVTTDPSLAEQIHGALEYEHALRTALPALGPLQDALEEPPLLLLLDAAGTTVETRRRLRALVEALHLQCPLVLLGSGQDAEALRRFATELRAAWSWDWNPSQTPFFRRLVQGIIRRHGRPEPPPEGLR
jgi:hypothetical protein